MNHRSKSVRDGAARRLVGDVAEGAPAAMVARIVRAAPGGSGRQRQEQDRDDEEACTACESMPDLERAP